MNEFIFAWRETFDNWCRLLFAHDGLLTSMVGAVQLQPFSLCAQLVTLQLTRGIQVQAWFSMHINPFFEEKEGSYGTISYIMRRIMYENSMYAAILEYTRN